MGCTLYTRIQSPSMSTTSFPSLNSDDTIDQNENKNKSQSPINDSSSEDSANNNRTSNANYDLTPAPSPSSSSSPPSLSSPSSFPSPFPSSLAPSMISDIEHLPQIENPSSPGNISDVLMGSTASSHSDKSSEMKTQYNPLLPAIIALLALAVFMVVIGGVYRKFLLYSTSSKRGLYTIVE